MMKHYTTGSAVWGFCLLIALGCSCGAGRQALEGTVTLDGAPVTEGSILFLPQAGTTSPICGGAISQGHFFIAPTGGAASGTFRVEITAVRKTGRKVKSSRMGQSIETDEREQYIPASYNQQSKLTATVTEQGPNRFEFALKSK